MHHTVWRFKMAPMSPSGSDAISSGSLTSKYQERITQESITMVTPALPWMQLRDGSLLEGDKLRKPKSWRRIMKGDRAMMVVMVMLLLTVTMPLWWRIPMTTERPAENESDLKLVRVVRALHSIQEAEERQDFERHLVSARSVQDRFPWITQNNTLPNYFLRSGGGRAHRIAAVQEDAYRDGNVIFVQQHRAGGAALSQCLTEIAQRNMLSKAVPWTSDARAGWELDVTGSGNSSGTRLPEAQVQMGQYSFGMCKYAPGGRCSYFTMLRDPMARAVSSYHYCRQAAGQAATDEMCGVLKANDVTLRDWILHQGSLTFQQLAYDATSCGDWSARASNESLEGTAVALSDPGTWPCWFKNRLQLHRLSQPERKHLLDYILVNLEKWFSVIGLVEEFDTSVQMLDHVYRIPFSKCSGIRKFVVDDSVIHDNKANRKNRKDGYYDDNDPEYLQYDYFVRSALDADNMIYKKAKHIFNVQRQMVLNRIKK